MSTLQISPYKPQSSEGKPHLRACEACYSKKIKCDTGGHDKACSYCSSHSAECRPRTRKRKAANTPNGAQLPPQKLAMATASMTSTASSPSPIREKREPQREPKSAIEASQESPKRPAEVPFLFVTYQPARVPISSPDAFENSSYISRTAILGTEFGDIDHSHGDGKGSKDHVLSDTDLEVLKLYRAFDLPDAPMRQSLVDAFVAYGWTWMPVVNLSTLTGTYTVGDGSLLVLQAVLLVGAIMRPEVCTKAYVEAQYRRVKALLNCGYERDPLHLLTALCLIQYYSPAAPKDVSTDVPRAWATTAAGLAQQIGLHRSVTFASSPNSGVWRRVWWTLCARDSLMASAHGRPRTMSPADSTNAMITINDFEDPQDPRARVFVEYVKSVQILGDLCQVLTRNGRVHHSERADFTSRIKSHLDSLPEQLTLSNRGYDLELAQLHVPILSTISILHRPRSVFTLTSANAISIVAANLAFRILQAIELRNQTKLLSSAFAWHLFAICIPHLSALRVRELRSEASRTLDELEQFMTTLGQVRPAAKQNLRNVRAIRRAITVAKRSDGSRRNTPESMPPMEASNEMAHSNPEQLLQAYGPEVLQHYHRIFAILQDVQTSPAASSDMMPMPTPLPLPPVNSPLPNNSHITLNNPMQYDPPTPAPMAGYQQDLFSNLFGDSLQDNTWMKDWMDDLQLMPE